MSRRREIIWVEGNHDEGLYDTIPSLLNILAVKEYEWTVNGKRLLAIHGYQFDRFSTNRSILASCAGGLYRLLRRIDIMLDDNIFHRLCFENESWNRSSSLVNEGGLDYASERDANSYSAVTRTGPVESGKTASSTSIPGAGAITTATTLSSMAAVLT